MTLRLNASGSGYVEVDSPSSATPYTLILPNSSGTARQTMMTDGAGAMSFQWDAGSLFYRLNADLAGANVNTAQSVFGVGVTLAGSTVYRVDATHIFTKTAGATSHTVGIGFGGTATINNLLFAGAANWTSTTSSATIGNISGGSEFSTASAANLAITNALASSSYWVFIKYSGTVSINAGGTFIPQYTLSAAPGGAYSTVAGSYIKFTPIGAAGSASSQGTWS